MGLFYIIYTIWQPHHLTEEKLLRRLPKSQVDSKLTSTKESTQTVTEPSEVLIALPEEDSEVDNQRRCSLVTNKRLRPDTSSLTDSRNSLSPTRLIWRSSS